MAKPDVSLTRRELETRIIAKAWGDPAFKAKLLRDRSARLSGTETRSSRSPDGQRIVYTSPPGDMVGSSPTAPRRARSLRMAGTPIGIPDRLLRGRPLIHRVPGAVHVTHS
jgi:hypothetical protein